MHYISQFRKLSLLVLAALGNRRCSKPFSHALVDIRFYSRAFSTIEETYRAPYSCSKRSKSCAGSSSYHRNHGTKCGSHSRANSSILGFRLGIDSKCTEG